MLLFCVANRETNKKDKKIFFLYSNPKADGNNKPRVKKELNLKFQICSLTTVPSVYLTHKLILEELNPTAPLTSFATLIR